MTLDSPHAWVQQCRRFTNSVRRRGWGDREGVIRLITERKQQRDKEELEERISRSWIALWSVRRQRPYYHNAVTNETRWTLPKGVDVQSTPPPENANEPEVVGSSGEWTLDEPSRRTTMSSSSQSGNPACAQASSGGGGAVEGTQTCPAEPHREAAETVGVKPLHQKPRQRVVAPQSLRPSIPDKAAETTSDERTVEDGVNVWFVECSKWKDEWFPSYHHRATGAAQWERPPEVSEEWSTQQFDLKMSFERANSVIAREQEKNRASADEETATNKDCEEESARVVRILEDDRKLNRPRS